MSITAGTVNKAQLLMGTGGWLIHYTEGPKREELIGKYGVAIVRTFIDNKVDRLEALEILEGQDEYKDVEFAPYSPFDILVDNYVQDINLSLDVVVDSYARREFIRGCLVELVKEATEKGHGKMLVGEMK